jgi:hypothetical protein
LRSQKVKNRSFAVLEHFKAQLILLHTFSRTPRVWNVYNYIVQVEVEGLLRNFLVKSGQRYISGGIQSGKKLVYSETTI